MHRLRRLQWILLGILALAGLASLGALTHLTRKAVSVEGAPVPTAWADIVQSLPDPKAAGDGRRDLFKTLMNGRATESAISYGFAYNNRFLSESALLMLVGSAGFGLMVTALARRASGRWALLTTGGTLSVVGFAFWAFGFNLAYPGEFVAGGFLPENLPGLVPLQDFKTLDYYLGYSVLGDFLFQMAYAMASAMIVLGLAAGRYRTPLIFLSAVAVGGFGYALNCSWLWGGGWLLNREAHDFGGSAMIYLLGGGAALGLVLLARLCPPWPPWKRMAGFVHGDQLPPPPDRLSRGRVALFLIGGIGFLGIPWGSHAGSCMAPLPALVAEVTNASIAALASGTLAALAVSIPLARRPRVVIGMIGAMAGAAAIAGPVDLVSISSGLATESISRASASLIGAIAGAGASLLAWGMDRSGFDDPLGVVPSTLVGGATGVITAAVVSPDVGFMAQSLLLAASVVTGFTITVSLGLVMWLLGLLWKAPATPPATRPASSCGDRETAVRNARAMVSKFKA